MLDRLCLQLLFELRIPVPLGLGSVSRKLSYYPSFVISIRLENIQRNRVRMVDRSGVKYWKLDDPAAVIFQNPLLHHRVKSAFE